MPRLVQDRLEAGGSVRTLFDRPTDQELSDQGTWAAIGPWNKSTKIEKKKMRFYMFRIIKRFFNREKIEVLELELRSLELRLPSMKDKARRSNETARYVGDNLKAGFGTTDSEVARSKKYYQDEADTDEREVVDMKQRILEIESELERLGRS